MIAYIAARFSRLKEMLALVPLFKENNITVCSRWLHETCAPGVTLADLSPSYNRECAATDLEDIDSCDTFVFFSEDPLVGTPRGGRHCEFGFALARGKRVIVIGGHENIFHYLPQVIHYLTVQSFLEGEGIDNASD